MTMLNATNKKALIIKLDAYIDENDQLVVCSKEQEPGLNPIVLRPERGLEELVADYPTELTVEVHDFVQRGTVYEVYGATLEDDDRTIAAHWKSTGVGQMCSFAISSPAEASKIKLFIGALPRRKDAPVPLPLGPRSGSGSGSGPFPTSVPLPPRGS